MKKLSNLARWQANNKIICKISKLILIIFGFFVILSLTSNTFDGDFGWHLRFGRDAWHGNFQYTDGYTYSYLGRPWINHEWGGDMLFWWLQNNLRLGYFSLVILISAALWAAFLLTLKIFKLRFTPASIIITMLTLLSVSFIMMMRLSMLSPLFFVLIWWTLEKLPAKKTYYWWPVILWLWSIIHGSWILGFIVINIYLAGNVIQKIITEKWPKSIFNPQQNSWDTRAIFNVLSWQAISGLIILINPYDWKIWWEIAHYFTNNFHKAYINEWLPSYSYPVYWGPLLIAAVGVVALMAGWQKRKVGWPHLLLFVGFFISAWQYKRNNMFLALICAPLIVASWQIWLKDIKHNRVVGQAVVYIICLAYAIFALPRLRVNNNIWQDGELLNRFSFPVEATKFLNQKTGDNRVRVFNSYGWGGYLNWSLPNALLFLDGRSAATWQEDDKTPLLKKYIEMMVKPDMVAELERQKVKFVILENHASSYPPPNWANKLLFSRKDLNKVMSVEPTQLEKDLRKNKKWKLVYSDLTSNVWERIKN